MRIEYCVVEEAPSFRLPLVLAICLAAAVRHTEQTRRWQQQRMLD